VQQELVLDTDEGEDELEERDVSEGTSDSSSEVSNSEESSAESSSTVVFEKRLVRACTVGAEYFSATMSRV